MGLVRFWVWENLEEEALSHIQIRPSSPWVTQKELTPGFCGGSFLGLSRVKERVCWRETERGWARKEFIENKLKFVSKSKRENLNQNIPRAIRIKNTDFSALGKVNLIETSLHSAFNNDLKFFSHCLST